MPEAADGGRLALQVRRGAWGAKEAGRERRATPPGKEQREGRSRAEAGARTKAGVSTHPTAEAGVLIMPSFTDTCKCSGKVYKPPASCIPLTCMKIELLGNLRMGAHPDPERPSKNPADSPATLPANWDEGAHAECAVSTAAISRSEHFIVPKRITPLLRQCATRVNSSKQHCQGLERSSILS